MTKIDQKRRVFTGRVTRVDEIDLNFENGKHATYEVVSFDTITGVSILPIEQSDVILMRHYMVGINEIGWSLPSGGLNEGEDPNKRAQLELQEEVGFKAGKLTLLTRSHALPGYFGGTHGYLFLAEELTKSRLPGDEEYPIEVVRLPLEQALLMVKSGEILDTRTALALLFYDRFFRKGR